ncbi:hypothetical protein MSPP1_000053 [Malassezia sp. CBS 17886]|nr:hypothetical protein MSPP1_000053 [Malassezia sp. CBS 17886]
MSAPKNISSRLQGLKFMQRGMARSQSNTSAAGESASSPAPALGADADTSCDATDEQWVVPAHKRAHGVCVPENEQRDWNSWLSAATKSGDEAQCQPQRKKYGRCRSTKATRKASADVDGDGRDSGDGKSSAEGESAEEDSTQGDSTEDESAEDDSAEEEDAFASAASSMPSSPHARAQSPRLAFRKPPSAQDGRRATGGAMGPTRPSTPRTTPSKRAAPLGASACKKLATVADSDQGRRRAARKS